MRDKLEPHVTSSENRRIPNGNVLASMVLTVRDIVDVRGSPLPATTGLERPLGLSIWLIAAELSDSDWLLSLAMNKP